MMRETSNARFTYTLRLASRIPPLPRRVLAHHRRHPRRAGLCSGGGGAARGDGTVSTWRAKRTTQCAKCHTGVSDA